MGKKDFKKIYKELYKPPKKIVDVSVPELNFFMIDGKGDPNNSTTFQTATELLYALSYTLKFMVKNDSKYYDYTVMPLEGLWSTKDKQDFDQASKDKFIWTIMIMQPDFVDEKLFESVKKELSRKKPDLKPDNVRLEKYAEGLSAQVLYLGAYSDEKPTIKKIHEFIKENKGQFNGKHHEIYLSDPRKTADEKLKTIIRQPFC